MSKQHSFFGSAILYTFGVVLGLGAQFLLTRVIYGQLMDATQLGYSQIYYTWFSVFGAVVGLEGASSVNNARIQYGQGKLNTYSSSLLGIGFITLGISAVVLVALQTWLVPLMGFSLPILLSALVQGFFMYCTVLLAQKCRVSGKPVQFVVWSSLAQLLRLALCTVFVMRMQQDRYLGDVYGSLLAYGIAGALAFVFLVKDGKSLGNRTYWKYCIAITGPIVFHTLSNLVLGQADTLMLKGMRTEAEVGVYSFAYGIGSIANAVWMAFNNAWTVWYFDKCKEQKDDEVRGLYRKYAGFVTLFSFAIILIAPDLVRWFATDPQVQAGANLTPAIMMGCFFMFLYTFPVNYETYKEKTVYIAIGTLCAAGVNIGLNLYFIPRWGAMGAALTTLISYAALFLFHYVISGFIIRGFQIRFGQLLAPAAAAAGVSLLTFFTLDHAVLRWVGAVAALIAAFVVFRKSRHIMMN